MGRRKTVVLGLLGPTLDAGMDASRWERWRPTVALFQHEDLLVDRLELLRQRKFDKLARTVTADIATVSPETEVRVTDVELDDPWDFEQVYGALHDFASAYPFDTDKENYLVHITTGTHVAQICLFLLTESRHLPARLVQTSPPHRQPSGSAGSYTIIDLDLSKYDRLASRFEKEQRRSLSVLKSGIETRNPAFNRLVEQIEKAALGSRAPLLLTGPTGAGKTRLARRIYELKKARRQVEGAFVESNCATLRGDAAMSALFGHVRGAFTGAVKDRPGLLRAAHGGLLFLDEIAELGLDEQAMLLRALEEKVFVPLGSDREVHSDFQLVAGTNRDLRARVREGLFRDDLLARIDTWVFRLPGLAERPEDIEPNLDYELDRHSEASGTRLVFSREARARFLEFAVGPQGRWSGNFRDLGAAVLRLGTLAAGGRITLPLVEDEIARLCAAWGPPAEANTAAPAAGGATAAAAASAPAPASPVAQAPAPRPAKDLLPPRLASIDRFERVQLEDVLQVCAASGTLSEAGRILFASSIARRGSRNDADRLRKYLTRHGIDWRRVVRGGAPAA